MLYTTIHITLLIINCILWYWTGVTKGKTKILKQALKELDTVETTRELDIINRFVNMK